MYTDKPLYNLPSHHAMLIRSKRRNVQSLLEQFRKHKSTLFSYDKETSELALVRLREQNETVLCFQLLTTELKGSMVFVSYIPGEILIRDIFYYFKPLTREAHNTVFDMFVDEYITDDIEAKYEVARIENYDPIDYVLDKEVLESLREWEATCERKRGYNVSCNTYNLGMLAITAHLHDSPMTPQFIESWLKKICKWETEFYEDIDFFTDQYDTLRKTLNLYDTEKELFDIRHPKKEDKNPTGIEVDIKDVRTELSKCFIHPYEKDDMLGIHINLYSWLKQSYKDLTEGNTDKAIEIAVGILDEIGTRYETETYYKYIEDYSSLHDDCLNAAYIITQIMEAPTTDQSTKDTILSKLEALTAHSSYKTYDYFDIDKFIANKGIYHFKFWWKSMFEYLKDE